MKIHFFGAAKSVTGSCYMVETERTKILIDCGMRQGDDAKSQYGEGEFAFEATKIDCVLLTHAHIDHSGLLPLLVKQGFKGKIIATDATVQLCSIMLPDSGHIQENETQYLNNKRRRQGKMMLEPLYTAQEARDCLAYFKKTQYNKIVDINNEIQARFIDAGHLLGSAAIEIWVTDPNAKNKQTKLVFSGDIGRAARPIISDPQTVEGADYLIMEGTYGDRLHKAEGDKAQLLAEIIRKTFKKGGNLIIPSFAVGRTQEMLYYIGKIIRENRLKDISEIPVYIDSPLGIEATRTFSRCAEHYYDDEARSLLERGIDPINFPSLHIAQTVSDSKAINFDQKPKVIISSSGMCEAGRIKHHLKHNLWREESTILFVGYQAKGTLGNMISNGKKTVKLFGEEIMVRAAIEHIEGFSGHADCDELIDWTKALCAYKKPQQIFLVHGEAGVLEQFKGKMRSAVSKRITVPALFDVFEAAYHDTVITQEAGQKSELDTKIPAALERQGAQPKKQDDMQVANLPDYDHMLQLNQRILNMFEQIKLKADQSGDCNEEQQRLLQLMGYDLEAFADKWKKMIEHKNLYSQNETLL